ncbi:MFS transporter [Lactobacillus ultunensis]|nr:MFS transporter [Lactobacillus ultunensis]QQP28593.1 MFS transporter [Lactobacillus ultunensis]
MSKSKIKFALFAMATTFFAVGVTEFISVGVLPSVSAEFHVSTSTAGLITTLYALGVAVGAPILTLLTSGFAKKKVIIGALIVFSLGHLLITFAPTFITVLIGRFIAGAAHGLLFALSSIIAAELVSPSKQASAIAFIFSGFTIATAIGAPLGTSISTFISWRIPFLAITILGLLALVMNIIVLPKDKANNTKVNLGAQLHIFTQPHILLTLLVTILGYGGTFATFTYLSPILERVTMVKSEYISIILVIYGIAIAIGNSIGGKFGDSNPVTVLFMIFIIQGLALIAFYFTTPYFIPAIINIIILGLFAFMSVPVLQSYILILAKSYTPESMDIASSLNISSFSFGIVLGSFVGGQALNIWGLRSTALIAGMLLAITLIMMLIEMNLEKKRQTLVQVES